jgi:hypothetical protein
MKSPTSCATPLASIALHASALQGPLDEVDRRQSLDRLAQDAMRSGHVLSQVLALARASQTEMTEAAQPVDVAALARRVVSDFAPQALSRGHVAGLCGTAECTLRGHPVLLELALRNLVENAVSHTPAGTSIDVQLDESGRWLQVRDDGRSQAVPGHGTGARPRGSRSGSGSATAWWRRSPRSTAARCRRSNRRTTASPRTASRSVGKQSLSTAGRTALPDGLARGGGRTGDAFHHDPYRYRGALAGAAPGAPPFPYPLRSPCLRRCRDRLLPDKAWLDRGCGPRLRPGRRGRFRSSPVHCRCWRR